MEKTFVGNVKEFKNNYWTMYNLWLSKDDIKKLVFNEKWFANINIKQSKKGKWYAELYIPDNINNYENDQEDEMPF